MVLLCSSLLNGEEAKITVTVREVSAEGPYSATGKIDTGKAAVRVGARIVTYNSMNI